MDLVEAGTDDVDALVDRWKRLADAMAVHDELNELAPEARTVAREGFRTHREDDAVTDYLVRHDGETIGFVTLREDRRPSMRASRHLRIVNLAIDEGHRERGHGTAVLERVRAMARERGVDAVEVGCEWDNEDARRFYRQGGFRPKRVVFARPTR